MIISSINENDIEVRCEISSSRQYNNKNIDIKISNKEKHNQKISSLNISSNQGSFFHDFTIDKSYLSTNNIIYIEPLYSEDKDGSLTSPVSIPTI